MTNHTATAKKQRRHLKRKTYASRVALETAAILLDSPAAAARRLGTSRQQIYKLLHRGVLTSVKIGKSRKIHIESIERVAASGA
jgi:excisionase family DNA binding protein